MTAAEKLRELEARAKRQPNTICSIFEVAAETKLMCLLYSCAPEIAALLEAASRPFYIHHDTSIEGRGRAQMTCTVCQHEEGWYYGEPEMHEPDCALAMLEKKIMESSP